MRRGSASHVAHLVVMIAHELGAPRRGGRTPRDGVTVRACVSAVSIVGCRKVRGGGWRASADVLCSRIEEAVMRAL